MNHSRDIAGLRARLHALQPARLDTATLARALPLMTNTKSVQAVIGHLKHRADIALSDNDLYTSFTALAALYKHDAALVSGEQLGSAVRTLIAYEQQPGGPYRTPGEQPVIVTNCAIARFMASVGRPLPGLTAYLAATVHVQDFAHNRQDEVTTAYHLAASGHGSQLLAGWARRQLTTTSTIAQRFQLWRVLQLCGKRLPPDADTTIAAHLAACLPRKDLDESLIVVGMELLCHRAQTAKHPDNADYDDVIQTARQACRHLPPTLNQGLQAAITDISHKDRNHEIALLAAYFTLPETNTACNWRDLGAANIFCWIAYTIYDHIIDDEPGAPARLPLANAALRLALHRYQHCSPAGSSFVERTFAKMDAANMWELQNCRFTVADGTIQVGPLPRYGNRLILAHRAYGHILGPLLCLMTNGQITGRQFTCAAEGLQHYLIARQLSDDIHDWQADLANGQINWIVADILRQLRILPGAHNLSTLTQRAKKYFWQRGLSRHTATILSHIAKSRTAFRKSGCITAGHPVIKLLDTLEAATRAAIDIHTQSRHFAAAYTQTAASDQ